MFDFAVLDGWIFWFGSGAGGWRTTLEISSDGTFYGRYTDSEMGSTGEGYPNGIVYVCNFTGKFTSAKKVGDYEYSLQCENLEQEGKEGDEEIADGIKYVTSTPYGVEGSGEFRLYLPGKKVSELPTEYLDWVYFAVDGSDTFNFYGLYNITGKQGFSSDDSNALPGVGGTDDVYSDTMLTFTGFSRSSVGVSAWIEKGNVAEDNRDHRYTPKGDTLTVKYVDDDEVFGTDFSDTYRGASIEGTFDLEDESEDENPHDAYGTSDASGTDTLWKEDSQ
jgi:hypothetical protein